MNEQRSLLRLRLVWNSLLGPSAWTRGHDCGMRYSETEFQHREQNRNNVFCFIASHTHHDSYNSATHLTQGVSRTLYFVVYRGIGVWIVRMISSIPARTGIIRCYFVSQVILALENFEYSPLSWATSRWWPLAGSLYFAFFRVSRLRPLCRFRCIRGD